MTAHSCCPPEGHKISLYIIIITHFFFFNTFCLRLVFMRKKQLFRSIHILLWTLLLFNNTQSPVLKMWCSRQAVIGLEMSELCQKFSYMLWAHMKRFVKAEFQLYCFWSEHSKHNFWCSSWANDIMCCTENVICVNQVHNVSNSL